MVDYGGDEMVVGGRHLAPCKLINNFPRPIQAKPKIQTLICHAKQCEAAKPEAACVHLCCLLARLMLIDVKISGAGHEIASNGAVLVHQCKSTMTNSFGICIGIGCERWGRGEKRQGDCTRAKGRD